MRQKFHCPQNVDCEWIFSGNLLWSFPLNVFNMRLVFIQHRALHIFTQEWSVFFPLRRSQSLERNQTSCQRSQPYLHHVARSHLHLLFAYHRPRQAAGFLRWATTGWCWKVDWRRENHFGLSNPKPELSWGSVAVSSSPPRSWCSLCFLWPLLFSWLLIIDNRLEADICFCSFPGGIEEKWLEIQKSFWRFVSVLCPFFEFLSWWRCVIAKQDRWWLFVGNSWVPLLSVHPGCFSE